jgi:hypothetical protein
MQENSANKYHIMNKIWEKKKFTMMRKFAVLKHTDLIFTTGEEDKMFEKLRTILGKTDAEILRIIIDS